MAQKTLKSTFRDIDMTLIDRPDDIVRVHIDGGELEELVNSIDSRGLLQPIGVSPRGDRFMIVFGDRRYLAHEILKRKKIRCCIEEREESQVVIDRAVENINRVNLTPFEEGRIYKGLVDKTDLSIDAICGMTGKSPGVVQRKIDILRMPESFQKALHARYISMSVAEELWSCPDGARREYFLDMAVEHGVTKAVAREWVSDFKKELRSATKSGGDGGGVQPVTKDIPIFRACDVCRKPVEYKDVQELRVCPKCNDGICEAISKHE